MATLIILFLVLTIIYLKRKELNLAGENKALKEKLDKVSDLLDKLFESREVLDKHAEIMEKKDALQESLIFDLINIIHTETNIRFYEK
jgi:hypothetical protein